MTVPPMQMPLPNPHPLFARLMLCALLLVAQITPAHAIDTRLPDLGNSAGGLMTPKQERNLGKAFMRRVRGSLPVMDDPVLTDYVQQLGQRLVNASGARGTPFNFFLIDDPQINAFAGPGGYIGIFAGLLLTAETESELAAVMAHEIAHVTQQHLLRAWESTSQMSIPSAAILLAALVLGAAAGGGDAAAAAAVGSQAALIQQRINFTRANEKEADRVGIDILAEAKFEPRAMPSFFDRMGKANRVYATKLPEFLLTHPVTANRTADALGRAEQFPYRQTTDDLRYHLARINLVQRRFNQPQDAVRELRLMLEDGRFRNETAVRYGIALAQLRADRLDAAAKEIDALLKAHPGVTEFIVARAQIDLKRGANSGALQRLEAALAAAPSSYALNLSYAETALALGKAAAAETQLRRFLSFRNDEPRVFQLLVRAAGEQDRRVHGHTYLAEFYHLTGELESAILQLEIALKQPQVSFYDASKLEAKLAALKAEQAAEEER